MRAVPTICSSDTFQQRLSEHFKLCSVVADTGRLMVAERENHCPKCAEGGQKTAWKS